MKRVIFYLSDGTGITAETLGHSLLSQFDSIEFEQKVLPYIDTVEKAKNAVAAINQVTQEQGQPAILFATIVDSKLREIIRTANAVCYDHFEAFLKPLEKELGITASKKVGRSHGVTNFEDYKTRIEAVNYALATDDGTNVHNYNLADLILVGVSRCGKTPTCLYLALQCGLYTANYPLTDDDLAAHTLPQALLDHRKKLVGLTISAKQLSAIRQERRPNSQYASLQQCQRELKHAQSLFQKYTIPYLDTSTHSVEEISTKILSMTGLKRRFGA